MKTWQFWVIVLVFIFVVVPLIYFAVIAKNVAKVIDNDAALDKALSGPTAGAFLPVN